MRSLVLWSWSLDGVSSSPPHTDIPRKPIALFTPRCEEKKLTTRKYHGQIKDQEVNEAMDGKRKTSIYFKMANVRIQAHATSHKNSIQNDTMAREQEILKILLWNTRQTSWPSISFASSISDCWLCSVHYTRIKHALFIIQTVKAVTK